MYFGNAVASGVVSLAEPIHQGARAMVQQKLAQKQQKFEAKEAQKDIAHRQSEAMKDFELQLRQQSLRGPSILPIILAGVGTLILMGGMIYFVTKD